MRDPNNIIQIEVDASKSSEIYPIHSLPDFDFEDYDLDNPKDFKRYIDSVERICRNSFEYRRFVYFLRSYMNMNKCSFLKDISNEETFKIKIHLHHEPITLYDMVIAVYNRRVANREPITEDMVAKEVMYQHYMLRVGLIPLSETVHELVHNQFLFVPTSAVFGKYWEFVDIYKDYMDPNTIATLEKIEAISKDFNMNEANDILKTSLIYIDTNEVFDPLDLDKIKDSMKDRINEIMDNPEWK